MINPEQGELWDKGDGWFLMQYITWRSVLCEHISTIFDAGKYIFLVTCSK